MFSEGADELSELQEKLKMKKRGGDLVNIESKNKKKSKSRVRTHRVIESKVKPKWLFHSTSSNNVVVLINKMNELNFKKEQWEILDDKNTPPQVIEPVEEQKNNEKNPETIAVKK